jgi:phospholipase C
MTVMRLPAALSLALTGVLLSVSSPAASAGHGQSPGIDHIVVIYEENHSFDNLFGGWEQVDGTPRHAPRQVAQDATVLPCLPQVDVNLTSPPLPVTCSGPISSAFHNAPFLIDRYITAEDTTCPKPGQFLPNGVPKGQGEPGGCTRDLVHRFYNEQYQIDGGRMDRYVAGSDAAGLTMGNYATRNLPIYQYLHGHGAPHYTIADQFFQSAFGGSFLNHQWLVAASTPVWPNAPRSGPDDLHSIVGPDGFPAATPLHPATPGTQDGVLTQAANPDGSCVVPDGGPTPPRGTACGDWAVNTVQPPYQPFKPGTPESRRLPPQAAPTIGDRLSASKVDWVWYSGGWDDAAGNVGGPGWTNGASPGVCGNPRTAADAVWPNCPDATFQFHHQPFNYYASLAPGTPGRAAHLRDETEFIAAAKAGKLKPVSFVKPVGEENEHPGYASEHAGSRHLVDLLKAVELGPDAARTLVIVTYDEFGGQWDHVAPPRSVPGISDKWGPGTRIPAFVISPLLRKPFSVDHTSHDTTSILATIEHRFGLAALSGRDASVHDLWRAAT